MLVKHTGATANRVRHSTESGCRVALPHRCVGLQPSVWVLALDWRERRGEGGAEGVPLRGNGHNTGLLLLIRVPSPVQHFRTNICGNGVDTRRTKIHQGKETLVDGTFAVLIYVFNRCVVQCMPLCAPLSLSPSSCLPKWPNGQGMRKGEK